MQHTAVAPADWPRRMLNECALMVAFAMREGLPLAPASVSRVQAAEAAAAAGADVPVADLSDVHAELCRLIAPATPEGLEAAMPTADAGRTGVAPVLRRLMLIALASLAAFIALSLSPLVTGAPADVVGEAGWPLLLTEMFFLSAGLLGASLAMMPHVQRLALRGFPRPGARAYFNLQLAAGAVAGLVLPGFVPQGWVASTAFRTGQVGAAAAVLGGMLGPLLVRIARRLSTPDETAG